MPIRAMRIRKLGKSHRKCARVSQLCYDKAKHFGRYTGASQIIIATNPNKTAHRERKRILRARYGTRFALISTMLTELQIKELDALRKTRIRCAVERIEQIDRHDLTPAYRCGLEAGWDLCADEVRRLDEMSGGDE